MTHRCVFCEGGAATRWRTFADGTRHIEALCPKCGAHLGFVEQTQEAVEAAAQEGARLPTPQLDLFGSDG